MKKREDAIKILRPYDDWYESTEMNEQARFALMAFYDELKRVQPDSFYVETNPTQILYMDTLLIITDELQEGKYQEVCREIISLHDYGLLGQGRVYYGLLECLEEYLMW